MAKKDIVKEHTNAVQNVVLGTWQDASQHDAAGEVIKAESREAPRGG